MYKSARASKVLVDSGSSRFKSEKQASQTNLIVSKPERRVYKIGEAWESSWKVRLVRMGVRVRGVIIGVRGDSLGAQ